MRILWLFVFGLIPLFASHFPSTLTDEEWEMIGPYILPDNHPAKDKIDRIFSQGRPTRSQEALKEAGFQLIKKHWSDTVVARHSSVPDFYFKLFTDDQDVNEIPRLTARIRGAKLAQEIVSSHGWNKLFKVPRKWLYLLPDPLEPKIFSKRMVLIAEDMRILSKEDNYKKWKSSLSKTLLKALFTLLIEGGFNDSVYPFNLPFAKDGKIAVIDNDHYGNHPVPATKLLRYLHPKSQKYWNKLIQEAGPELAN